MKKISILLFIFILFCLCSCDENTAHFFEFQISDSDIISDGSSSIPSEIDNETISTIKTELLTETEDQTGKEENSPDVLLMIDDYLYYQDTGASLLSSMYNFNCYMWETIYKYPDDKSVSETFEYLNERTNNEETLEQLNEIICELYVEIIASDYDEECLNIIMNCQSTYMYYYSTMMSPLGSYSNFCDEYLKALVDYQMEADYNMVDYFNAIGYERKVREQ